MGNIDNFFRKWNGMENFCLKLAERKCKCIGLTGCVLELTDIFFVKTKFLSVAVNDAFGKFVFFFFFLILWVWSPTKTKKKSQENCVTCEERIDRKVTNYPKVLVVGLSFLFHEKGNCNFNRPCFSTRLNII